MLNEKVRSAISRVVGVSKDARIIADRLLQNQVSTASDSSAEVIALTKQIEVLNSQLAELRLQLVSQADEEEVDQLDDISVHRFTETFQKTLGAEAFATISAIYTEEYITSFPRQIRFLMALGLVNWCTNRKFAPATLWHDLMVNNGSL